MMSSQAAVGPGLKAEASVEALTSSCDVRNKTVNSFGLYGEFSASEQLYGSFISLNVIKMRSYNIMLQYGTAVTVSILYVQSVGQSSGHGL